MKKVNRFKKTLIFSFTTLALIVFAACVEKPTKQFESNNNTLRETLIRDFDGDGGMDTVFVYDEGNRAGSYVVCKLSSLGFKSITSKNISDLEYISSIRNGFCLQIIYDAETFGDFDYTYNSEEKNMQLTDVSIWVGCSGVIRESDFHFRDGKWMGWNSRSSNISPNPVEFETEAIFLDSDFGFNKDY
ncbi:MAG: hypothetical protein LBU83_02440 [Bacteroidales bacterium]|jgi:hypothetical protein|nr:hypothetical protein [Bacteroidales bacterium]